MAWVVFRKAYAMVPYALKLIGQLSPNVIALLKSIMIDWKTELILGDTNLGGVNVNRGIFQGESLSLSLFILSLIPLALVLRRMKQGYSFLKGKSNWNHL